MSEESTTPDLVGLMREAFEAANWRDLDAVLTVYAPDGVLDLSQRELPSFEGVAAIRGFLEDWLGAYAEFQYEPEEILDLGNSVTFSVVRLEGRPVGSTGFVGVREGWLAAWVGGLIKRLTTYRDIDEARAAAQRLANERGRGG